MAASKAHPAMSDRSLYTRVRSGLAAFLDRTSSLQTRRVASAFLIVWASVSLPVGAHHPIGFTETAIPRPDGQAWSEAVGLTFDAKYAWPVYDWMGVAKAAFEATNRYLARDMGGRGIRCNLVSAGPLRTTAAKSIPGFEQFEEAWGSRAPLGWDVRDPEPAAKAAVALLSDWFPATTGEIVHVDGGFHAIGT